MFTGAIPQQTVATTDKSFAALGLSRSILDVLQAAGFENPTPIQAEVIPHVLAGRDVVGLAMTGSGKTAAFALPMAERLIHGRGVRGLVLCPTREIALQTAVLPRAVRPRARAEHRVRHRRRAHAAADRALRGQPDIVVATPGRLLDHLERGNVRLDSIEMLVLDEADHMLDLGFLPQMMRVLEALPRERQTMMFSATMPATVERLANRFMREPSASTCAPSTAPRAASSIASTWSRAEDKKPCLLALVEQEKGAILVFVRRKMDAEWACRQLEIEGHPVERIHSDRSQSQRVAALSGLRQGEHRILVATDIAARGIDIPTIEHIVNFNVPETVEDYVHRAGRTARGTAGGIVSTIATWQDKEPIRAIESAIGQELPRCTAPGVEPYQEARATIKGRERIRRRLR